MKYRTKPKSKVSFGRITQTTVHFRHIKKNHQLDVPDMQKILKIVEEGLGPHDNVMVRALNGQRFFTFKKYSDSQLKVQDFNDYYKNKVSETAKFEKFEYIEITVQRKTK